jgi:hypothetical protein
MDEVVFLCGSGMLDEVQVMVYECVNGWMKCSGGVVIWTASLAFPIRAY